VVQASEAELQAHARQLVEIQKVSKGACVWLQLEAPVAELQAASA
jgi:hypothetical protein